MVSWVCAPVSSSLPPVVVDLGGGAASPVVGIHRIGIVSVWAWWGGFAVGIGFVGQVGIVVVVVVVLGKMMGRVRRGRMLEGLMKVVNGIGCVGRSLGENSVVVIPIAEDFDMMMIVL